MVTDGLASPPRNRLLSIRKWRLIKLPSIHPFHRHSRALESLSPSDPTWWDLTLWHDRPSAILIWCDVAMDGRNYGKALWSYYLPTCASYHYYYYYWTCDLSDPSILSIWDDRVLSFRKPNHPVQIQVPTNTVCNLIVFSIKIRLSTSLFVRFASRERQHPIFYYSYSSELSCCTFDDCSVKCSDLPRLLLKAAVSKQIMLWGLRLSQRGQTERHTMNGKD